MNSESARVETNTTRQSLQLLIVEDSIDDALLVVRDLQRAGYDVSYERVETASAMMAALQRHAWDLVIADYTLPQFSGIAALELLKATGLDIPFIVVSGSIGEDHAVDAMRAGADNYIMKGNTKRLIPSVQHELRDREVRRQRRQAEEALHVSEARKAAIFDAALDSIISVDHQGLIIDFNPQAERSFHYHRDEVMGRPLADLIRSNGLYCPKEAFSAGIGLAIRSIVGKRVESTAIRRDGSEFPGELSLTSISPDVPMSTSSQTFIAYIRDLTDQKRREETEKRSGELQEQSLRIQEANRLKSVFLTNMSHELRTPLNAVIGFSQFLIDGKAGNVNPEQQEYLNDILNSGRHLLQLINDILDLAKIEAGKMDLTPETFAVKPVADEICGVMRSVASARNIEIHLEGAIGADVVSLDLRMFKQILYNLLSNAVKFSHERSTVLMSIDLDPDDIRFQVKDSGVGIRKSDLARIFQEFEQLNRGSTPQSQGTGLGLVLTKKMIELHHGSITVKSEFGKGSIFTVTLPRYATNLVSPPANPAGARGPGSPADA